MNQRQLSPRKSYLELIFVLAEGMVVNLALLRSSANSLLKKGTKFSLSLTLFLDLVENSILFKSQQEKKTSFSQTISQIQMQSLGKRSNQNSLTASYQRSTN